MRTQIPGRQILDQDVDTSDIKDRAVTDEKLSLTGVAAGTFSKVQVTSSGRVTHGENPTTLDGYGITDAIQSSAPIITAVNSSSTYPSSRYLVGMPNQTVLTDGGAGGSIIFKLAEDPVLPGSSGVVVPTGGTSLRGAMVDGKIRFNTETGVLETPISGIWQRVIVERDITTAPPPAVTMTSTNAAGTANSLARSDHTHALVLSANLNAVSALSTTGMLAHTGAGTFTTRSIAVGAGLSITNADGVAGNPTISLNLSGTNTAASGLLSTWTLVSTNRYYADFSHNLGTNNVVITLYDTATNAIVTADEVTLTSTNTVRVQVIGNSRTLRIVVVANGLAINTATPSAGTVTVAKDGVNVSTASRLNFTGQAVTVTDAGSGTTNVVVGSRFTFFAGAFETPNNSDWVVNALAPAAADPSFGSLTVRQFSNTTEQGVGFMLSVPQGATNITFKFRGRAQTSPASAAVVQPRIYTRLIPNGSAMGSWSAASNLSSIAIPTNAFFQYSNQTVSLASLGMTGGNTYQVELTRNVGVASNLAANFLLAELTVELS